MLRKVDILFRGQLFQFSQEHSWQTAAGWWHEAQSRVLVCPACQRAWAHIALEGDRCLYPAGAFCEDCGVSDSLHPVPGSLLISIGYATIDHALLEALPTPLLGREFALHVRALEKGSFDE